MYVGNFKILLGYLGYGAEEAANGIEQGKFDAVAFGTSYLANPDLPARFKASTTLNEADPATFYSPGPKGYTDYPALDKVLM